MKTKRNKLDLVKFTMNINPDQLSDLKTLAHSKQITLSQLIREALSDLVSGSRDSELKTVVRQITKIVNKKRIK